MNLQTTKLALVGLAEYYGVTLSENRLLMFANDLQKLSAEELAAAISVLKQDPQIRTMPLPAQILQAAATVIPDGHPGPEEAWALCPKTESDTAVWTEQISRAFFDSAYPLIEEDFVAARMAFKETYSKILAQARASGVKAKWSVTQGHDKSARDSALAEAVSKGRIGIEYARKFAPQLPDVEVRTAIAGLLGSQRALT